jgi:hypothetical protein
MFMAQQQSQHVQCMHASSLVMESLVSALELSIHSATDVHAIASACADVDHVTIIGLKSHLPPLYSVLLIPIVFCRWFFLCRKNGIAAVGGDA